MELSLLLASKLASMMLMVVVGFAIVRLGIMKVEDSKSISTLIVFVLTPCLIIRAFQIDLTPARLEGFFASVLFMAASYVVWILLAKLLKKPLKISPIDEATLVYTNVGNLTLPLVSMILGEEMVFYAGSLQLPFLLFIWTHGVMTIQGSRKIDLKKMLLNTNMIALYIGVALLALRIRIPEILDTTMEGFSSMVGPASMLVAGMVIAGRNLKTVFTFRRAYLIQIGRLLILPMLSTTLLYFSGILKAMPQLTPILMTVVIGLSAPAASTVSQLAVVYDKEPETANIYNVMGLMFCILTIPLNVWYYQWLMQM